MSAPVFLVAPPRSGGTLLFEVLARSSHAWTIGGESHAVIEEIPGLHPRDRGWDSNRLSEADATADVISALHRRFGARRRDRYGRRAEPNGSANLLEKTPKNALRVPFLDAAFPEARFIYLFRDPVETISSILEGWRSGEFVTYPDLPGWSGAPWSFLLVPGWRELRDRPQVEVVARQWCIATRVLLSDLGALDHDRWFTADFHHLLADPAAEVDRICGYLGWGFDDPLTAPLPLSRSVLTVPAPGKWRRNAAELATVLPLVTETAAQARQLVASRRGREISPRPT